MKVNEIIYFANEFDMLEAHLEEHKGLMEKTFIVESPVTVSGIEKPLFFEENKERFAKYNLEHIIVPAKLQPKTNEWSDFRIQDHAKNVHAHPIVAEGCDWVLHSDCDEILRPEKFVRAMDFLEQNEEWQHGCYKISQKKTWVNRSQKKVNVYRFVKAKKDAYVLSPKGIPRGAVSVGSAGWHFHNCFSILNGAEELYWKCLNRNWWFPDMRCPTIEECKYIWSQFPNIHKIPKTEIPYIDDLLKYVLCDDASGISKPFDAIDTLPRWMQENIERFPIHIR